MVSDLLLQVNDLHTEFRTQDATVRAVNGLSYELHAGESMAIVGESGSGKSVSVRSLLQLLPHHGRVSKGSALFCGKDLLALPERAIRRIRGRDIAYVFQDASAALNPTLTIGRQLTEHLVWHGIARGGEARERALAAMREVGLDRPETRFRQYPFQLSGGMRQRAMIAMALVTGPKVLIADEPTTALDVTLQRQILDVLRDLKAGGLSIILITHDLGVARYVCDRTIVMYAGRAVERADTASLLSQPMHPYTSGMLDSTLEVGHQSSNLNPIPGTPPNMANLPLGCPFAPRCPFTEERCRQEDQTLRTVGNGREVACWKAPLPIAKEVAR